MTCERIGDPRGKSVLFLCSTSEPEPPVLCACGREAEKLCDYKLDSGHTCDAPLCSLCAVTVARIERLVTDPCIRTLIRRGERCAFTGAKYSATEPDTVDHCRAHAETTR